MSTDIIIPTWRGNNKKQILKSLDSFLSEKKLINKIFLVVDGCKEFPSYLFFEHPLQEKIQIIYKYRNEGPGLARNIGVAFSKAENIIFLDAGDKSIENRVRIQTKSLQLNDISVGDIKEIKNKKRTSIRISSRSISKAIRILPYRTPFNNVTIAIKRKKFNELRGYPNLRTAEDWLFMGKVIKNGMRFSCEEIVLVEIEKDELFIKRRKGRLVFNDISFCIEYLHRLKLINGRQKFISLNIQRILRLYTPDNILSLIYYILRKNIS
tara:strand:+ start:710 stop:1510 length:801 start_codon:yes stop_codon:yes gene_type:complete